MDFLKAPEPLRTTGDLRKNWQLFKQRFEIFLTASETAEKPRPESTKAALLLSVAGEEAIEVFNTFTFAEGESNSDYATVVKKFDEYCDDQSNEVHERYIFRRRTQAAGEPVEHFLRDLKNQARACNFGALMESMVRDQIVFGINNDRVREKLLRDKNLTLQKAEQACKAAEASATHQEMWNQERQVDPVGRANASRGAREQPTQYVCRKCGGKHGPRSCPAFGRACRRCQRKNHFARCCKATTVVGELRSGDDDFQILDVSAKRASDKHDWTVQALIKNVTVELKVDTGAQANLLPYGIYSKLNPRQSLHPSGAILRSYSGDVIKHIGIMRAEVSLNGRIATLSFFVVRKGRQAILGLEASEQLGLISRVNSVSRNSSEEVVSNFRHLFTGTGCVKRVYHMVLRKDAVPVIQRARRVPLALEEPLRNELARMEQAGIIARVTEPTDWVSPLVIVRKKDGKLRICMDPRKINECLKRELYEMPRREDIEAELAGAKIFTRLDANAGFHQIPLDEETSRICTFATPFGRYRFLRLPFGISSASEVFQQTLSSIFDALSGVKVYVDDILVWGRSRQEHDERLKSVLEAAERAGLTFNPAKCAVGVQQIEFLGDVISEEGIRPSSSLVKCMLQMPAPSDKLAVQRMLGVVNYFGKFLPVLAERTTLLRSLLKKDTVFEWSANHEKEWRELCDNLSNQPLLSVFDPEKETTVSCDASQNGIGAALLQSHNGAWKPVAYASRVLTETQQRYSQIEKEAMAIVFGCERFNHFVYGRKVIVETDHRPLIAISQKAIGDMPPRLQRFFLRLLRYDISIRYVPGKQLLLADMLSRASVAGTVDDADEDVEVHAVSVVGSLISENTWKKLASETQNDTQLGAILKYLKNGEPIQGPLKSSATELSEVKGVLLKGCKVVIPASMRREMLERIHQGHMGINKCKERARQLVFWPAMNADIETFAQACAVCKKYAYKLPHEPLIVRPIPDQPWYRVGIDLFSYGGRSYLCVYDALSNFPEVQQLADTSAKTVVDATSAIFSRYGIPLEVCSDNGPQFSSREFKIFSEVYDFKHVTSSPYFPRSNGLAEKGVQVVKRILKKTSEAKQDFWLGLLAYRSTPLECGRTPAEILQGRNLRTTLPAIQVGRSQRLEKHQQTDYSRGPLKPLNNGDTVRIKNGQWARKAQVIRSSGQPRSYVVLTEDGQRLRRNREHLLPTNEPFHLSGPDYDDEDELQESTAPTYATRDAVGPQTSTSTASVAPSSQLLAVPRRTRQRRPPQRLMYDKNFQQVS